MILRQMSTIFSTFSLSLYSISVLTLFQEASSLNNPTTTVAASPSAISTTQNSTNNSYITTLFNEETLIHNENTTTTTQHTIPSEVVDTTYTAVVVAGNTYIFETIEKGDIPPLGATSDDHYYCNSYKNTNNNQSSTPCEQTLSLPNTSLTTTAAVVATGSNPSSTYNNYNEDQNGVVMKKCVGRSNQGVTFGEASEQGLRKTMEDTCGIYPEFMTLSCIEVGGCTAPSCRYASVKSPVHYFGVFDGHGGSQASSHCANELHIKLAEEWGKEVGIDDWRRRWEVALCRAFERVDDGLVDRTLASVGSTASVVILSACQIIAANCGNSRVVLCRGKQAIPLTVDHKLNRQDEVARITNGGGIIVEWGYCLRVEGVLSMTRAIGVPWTEEEHRLFLIGLQKLGKGDWHGIARNYVISRTPTQVASHAQKYFIRQSNATRRKRRSSLFDMVTDDMATDTPSVPEEQILHPSPLARETDNSSSIPSLNLSLNSEFEPMEAVAPPQETVKEPEESASGPNEFTESAFGSNGYTQMMHAFYPGAYMPVPYAYWPPNAASREEEEDKEAENCNHQILKPIPILPKEPVNVDELVGMSHLSIIETAERRYREPSPLSLKLLGEPSRQSAFHANAPVSNPDLSNGKTSPIQAI